jgi:hypothetical protein
MALTIINDSLDGVYREGEIQQDKYGNREIEFTGSGNSDFIYIGNNSFLTMGVKPTTATQYKIQYTILKFEPDFIPTGDDDFYDAGIDQDNSNGGNITGQMTGFRVVADGGVKVQFRVRH